MISSRFKAGNMRETEMRRGSKGSRKVVTFAPLAATDSDVFFAAKHKEQEDVHGQNIDQPGQGEQKAPKKIVRIKKSASKLSIAEQQIYIALKARIKALKEENQKFRSRLNGEAEISLQLQDENKTLLAKLRRKYPPDVVASLEAENPDGAKR